jgi:outer membrane receptor protein involved in Fe transport
VSTDWAVIAFNTVASDDIIFVGSGTLRGEGHFTNIPRTRRRGIEGSLDLTFERVSIFASYTVQRATFGADLRIASRNHPLATGGEIAVDDGDRLPNVPAHLGKAGFAAQVSARVTVGATMRAQSSQYFRGDEANLLAGTPGYAVVDARAHVRLAQRIAVVGEAQNLFNRRYATFGVLGNASLIGSADPRFHAPGTPRGAWLGVEVRF